MTDASFSVVVTFDVEPASQTALAQAVTEFAREVLAPRDGFRGATVHRSLDGSRVFNIVEWRAESDFRAYTAEQRIEDSARAVIALARPASAPAEVVARIAPSRS